jgi:hypothetical protein
MLPSLSPASSAHENPSNGSDESTEGESSSESNGTSHLSDEVDPSTRDSEEHSSQETDKSSSEGLTDEEDSSESASGDGIGEMSPDVRGVMGPEDDAIFWRSRECIHLQVPISTMTVYPGNDILTDQDRDNIRAFKLRMFGTGVTRRTFN